MPNIERYAALSAELEEPGVVRAELLAAFSLSDAQWTACERHWKEAMAGDDGAEITAAFRTARTAFEERLRKAGAVPVADYAKLASAGEGQELERALAKHELEARDLELVRRVWTRRAASDPEVARALAEAVEAARWE
jgi:hypothetical protein